MSDHDEAVIISAVRAMDSIDPASPGGTEVIMAFADLINLTRARSAETLGEIAELLRPLKRRGVTRESVLCVVDQVFFEETPRREQEHDNITGLFQQGSADWS